MEIKKTKVIPILILSALLLICFAFTSKPHFTIKMIDQKPDPWEEQLNVLNTLVMQASSINLLHGLSLSKEQAQRLIPLAIQVDQLNLNLSLNTTYYNNELQKICNTYKNLIGALMQDKNLSDTLKNEVMRAREIHSEIIKRSLLATQTPGYHAEGCRKCHAAPEQFPAGNISGKDTHPITSEDRKEIDLAHVKGLFGEEGTLLLWNLRDQVDEILTNEQKYVFNLFRCCLIPQEDVSNPGIFGQSFVTNEWIEYFRKVRQLNDKDWQDYKSLFIIPLGDILEAKMPGIKKKDKQKMLDEAEKVINDSRKLDEVDFELQKENLCVSLSNALKTDLLNGEANRQPEDRKFVAAMFMLYPGSSAFYMKLCGQQ
ncbi:MAG TPA: hypothetical protein PLT47_03050 [Bacteroidales bacterium]|nr:hypothetical protein [Bacteroidales bacterium]